MSRRRRIALLSIGVAIVLIATMLALSRGGSLRRHRFLDGAITVVDGRYVYGKSVIRCSIYNIHRPPGEVAEAMNRDLSAEGWKEISFPASEERTWAKPQTVGGTVSLREEWMAGAESGMAQRLKPGEHTFFRHSPEAAGWTMIYLIEKYEPNWIESVMDRFRGPVKTNFDDLDIGMVKPP